MKKLIGSLVMVILFISSFGICMAAENLVVLPDPGITKIAYKPALTKGSIDLTEGWNLVAMPVLPVAPYTVEQFIHAVQQDIPSAEGLTMSPQWAIKAVAVYKNGEFDVYPKEGVTYNMVPGEAYFVYAEYLGPRITVDPVENPDGTTFMPPVWHPRTSVTICGKNLQTSVSLNLNRGWNGVSVSPFNPVISDGVIDEIKIGCLFNLNQLSRELVEQGIKAKRVIFWNADKQEWEQYELPLEQLISVTKYHPIEGSEIIPDQTKPYHIGKIIQPNEGFFLLCDSNGLYLPAANLNQTIEPPFPPKPPIEERVSYTGNIVARVKSLDLGYPYDYVLGTAEGEKINLKPVNDKISTVLNKIYVSRDLCTVEGVIKYTSQYKVLMVDTVRPVDEKPSWVIDIDGHCYNVSELAGGIYVAKDENGNRYFSDPATTYTLNNMLYTDITIGEQKYQLVRDLNNGNIYLCGPLMQPE